MMLRSGCLYLLFVGIASAGKLWVDVCTQSNTMSLPFCDMTKTHEERAADYVNRVPLAQKARMMVNNGQPFGELHIPAYQWGSEGLHGTALQDVPPL